MMNRTRVAILVGSKGRGSNMEALIRASLKTDRGWEVALVISPVADNTASQTAREMGVEVVVLGPKDQEYEAKLVGSLQEKMVDIICLAGLMTKLPVAVLQAFPGRIINIHPSLLPKFGGKGMYGLHVHQAVLESGEAESGCTVHVVTEEYDDGPIVIQKKCPVEPGETVESLATKVLSLEHEIFPLAVDILAKRYAK